METDDLILTPLVDEPVSTGYNPNFSLRSAQERKEVLDAWANELMSIADSEGYALWPVGDVLQGASRFAPYPINWLTDDEWILSNLLWEAGLASAPHGPLDHFRHRENDKIVIYRAPEPSPTVRTKHYKKALSYVKFLTLMLPSLTDAEIRQADAHIDHWVKNDRYRRHLRGMLRWYNSRRRLLDARTKAVALQALDADDANVLISQLVELSASRGMELQPKSIYQLDRVMQLFGHPAGSVHALLHRAQCGVKAIAEHSSAKGTESLVRIDDAHLSLIESQTQHVQQLLADVFQAEEEPVEEVATCSDNSVPKLLSELAQREQWSLSEAESLAKSQGLALFPALEAINDYAIEHYGDTIADLDDDTLYITLPNDFKL